MLMRWAPWVLVVAALIGVWRAADVGWLAYGYQKDMFAAGANAATALFVVAVFLERSLAVINGLIFGVEQRQERARLVAALDRAAEAQAALAAAKAVVPATAASTQAAGVAVASLAQANIDITNSETESVKTEAKKERLRLLLGFAAAVAVSAAGARTLASLLIQPTSPAAPLDDQRALFSAVDILLTAGLLAGGSNGLAELIKLFKDQGTVAMVRMRAELAEIAAQRARR